MEIIESFANIISNHGLGTTMFAIGLGLVVWRGKTIMSWVIDTIKAAETVRLHESTMVELRKEVQMLREQIEENNRVILAQAQEIATLRTKLEAYEEVFTKSTARKSRRKINKDEAE